MIVSGLCTCRFWICAQPHYWAGNEEQQQLHPAKPWGKVLWVRLPFTAETFNVAVVQLYSELTGSFFPCHLHLCTWHHSYWSTSGSICAVFWGNAFQISWCFKHFFFNLASKNMAHLWSPGIIQIWSALGFWFTPCNLKYLKHLGRTGMYLLNIFL